MTLPLTQLALDQIRERFDRLRGLDVWADGDEIGDQVRADAAALLDEIERVSAALADAWLALDMIARDAPQAGAALHRAGFDALANDVGSLGHVAAKVLRMQRAPGWATPTKT